MNKRSTLQQISAHSPKVSTPFPPPPPDTKKHQGHKIPMTERSCLVLLYDFVSLVRRFVLILYDSPCVLIVDCIDARTTQYYLPLLVITICFNFCVRIFYMISMLRPIPVPPSSFERRCATHRSPPPPPPSPAPLDRRIFRRVALGMDYYIKALLMFFLCMSSMRSCSFSQSFVFSYIWWALPELKKAVTSVLWSIWEKCLCGWKWISGDL